jgi:hypothetical protein
MMIMIRLKETFNGEEKIMDAEIKTDKNVHLFHL